MEKFDLVQKYDVMEERLTKEGNSLKIALDEKNGEINVINDKNFSLVSNVKSLESNLRSQADNLKKLEEDFGLKQKKWKNNKTTLKKEIVNMGIITQNLIPYEEYKTEEYNYYNKDYIFQNLHKYQEQLKAIISVSKFFTLFFNSCDGFFEAIIERLNFLSSNIELKTEHRGYLFCCDKIRCFSFNFQQISRCISYFLKALVQKLEAYNTNDSSTGNDLQILLLFNIILTLVNKTVSYNEIITKYFKQLLLEERKLTNIDIDSELHASKVKVNKDLKTVISELLGLVKIFVKKLNFLFSFDLEYNLKNINIISDHTSMIMVQIKPGYFPNYKFVQSHVNKLELLNNILNSESIKLSAKFAEFSKHFEMKLDIEFKVFELIKEETKNKYNYPLINLISLRQNTELTKKFLKEINRQFEEMLGLNEKIAVLFTIKSWTFFNSKNNERLFNFLNEDSTIISKVEHLNNKLLNNHNNFEPGVEYNQAIRDRIILKELMEKEDLLGRDRENYINKITEYEEDIKRLEHTINEERNNNDLMIISSNDLKRKVKLYGEKLEKHGEKLLDLDGISNQTSTIHSESSSTTDVSINQQFSDYLKYQSNIADIQQEVLSDDVLAGKQRSSFKLSSDLNKGIPITKFTAQIEDNCDVSILYHQKIIEKIQRYASKIKNIDLKVLANSHSEDIKHEYELKIISVEKKLNSEIEEYQTRLKTLEDSTEGYIVQIDYLSEMLADLNNLKDAVRDCTRCNKFVK